MVDMCVYLCNGNVNFMCNSFEYCFFLKFVFLVKFILMMVMWLVLFSSVIFMIVCLFFDFKVMKLFWI